MVMTLNEAYASISQQVKELEDILQKSMPIPGEPMMKEEKSPDAAAPMGDGMAAPEASPDAAQPEVSPDAAIPAEGEAAPEAGADSMDVESIAKELEGMPDEELQTLIEILSHEMQSRSGAAPEAGAPAAEQPLTTPSESATPAMDEEKEGMKKEIDGMQKSMAALKSENEALKKSMKLPATKAAPGKNIEVLEKSVKQPESLTKQEVIDHLYRLQKSGDRRIDTDLMWFVTKVKTPEDLTNAIELAKLKGIKF